MSDNDLPAMRLAIELLQEHGHDVRRPSPHQLKIGSANYYPSTQAVFIDGEAAKRPSCDATQFVKLLETLGIEPHGPRLG